MDCAGRTGGMFYRSSGCHRRSSMLLEECGSDSGCIDSWVSVDYMERLHCWCPFRHALEQTWAR